MVLNSSTFFNFIIFKTFTTKLEGVGYKPEARNPLFAHADQSADTELRLLAKHFHPSVAHFAQSILEGLFLRTLMYRLILLI